jgi:hypothetical protein
VAPPLDLPLFRLAAYPLLPLDLAAVFARAVLVTRLSSSLETNGVVHSRTGSRATSGSFTEEA